MEEDEFLFRGTVPSRPNTVSGTLGDCVWNIDLSGEGIGSRLSSTEGLPASSRVVLNTSTPSHQNSNFKPRMQYFQILH